jgi:hypothetical protein
LSEFNARYPTGQYQLYTESKVSVVPIVRTYTAALTNDFPSVDPVITNVTPFLSLQSTQTFIWPVFTADPASYSRFYLLEGNLNTNILDSLIAQGIDSLTNNLVVLAWYLKLNPAQNAVTVTNIDPALDHLAILEHHHVNPLSENPLGLNEAASVSINATFFFALRIIGQPQSQTVEEGGVATMNVLAVGARPMSYQWRHNGVDILNATNLMLVIADVKKSDAGEYTVTVSNVAGTETSQAAILTVTEPLPPEPLTLSEPAMQIDRTFRFLVSGLEGGSYVIEASINLVDWEAIGNLSTPLGAMYYFDQSATNFPRRFYRARSLQN